jgi:hypothetical protein
MTSKYFYQNLKPFRHFETAFNNNNFTPVPKDWVVVITDIKSSTKSIEAGKYKDVNTVGAASIAAAHNAIKDLDFPYVFGGDGATMIIPSEYEDETLDELAALQTLSHETFNLSLRIGKVSVEEIFNAGGSISIAKYSLTPEKSIAFFRGGGLNIAEEKIKTDEERYCIQRIYTKPPNLNKLSCRWNSIPSQKGKILSLIVLSRQQPHTPTYHHILTQLKTIYSNDLDTANPVKNTQLHYKNVAACIQSEKLLHKTILSKGFFNRLVSITTAVFLFKFNFLKQYKESISSHSDYRKFDDMLRMVIDCDNQQLERIHQLLSDLYQQGKVYYGTHVSEHALMTCFVSSTAAGQHIHFIDGGDGGYAIATKQLKKQIRTVSAYPLLDE